jgi:hypothetical protein
MIMFISFWTPCGLATGTELLARRVNTRGVERSLLRGKRKELGNEER